MGSDEKGELEAGADWEDKAAKVVDDEMLSNDGKA